MASAWMYWAHREVWVVKRALTPGVQLIGPLIENIKFCLDNGGEEYSQEGFEVFHLLIDEAKFEVLENCAGGLFEFCQRVGCSEGLELETRKSVRGTR